MCSWLNRSARKNTAVPVGPRAVSSVTPSLFFCHVIYSDQAGTGSRVQTVTPVLKKTSTTRSWSIGKARPAASHMPALLVVVGQPAANQTPPFSVCEGKNNKPIPANQTLLSYWSVIDFGCARMLVYDLQLHREHTGTAELNADDNQSLKIVSWEFWRSINIFYTWSVDSLINLLTLSLSNRKCFSVMGQ